MAELNVGNGFKQSYENYLSYPTRLIYRTTYPSELQNYKDRLDQTSDTLCIQDEKRVDVGFRDWVPANSKGSNLNVNGPHVLKRADGDMVLIASNLKSKSEIKKWLGDNSIPGPGSQRQQTATPTVTKPDPKCRFIFVWAPHSKAHLKITKELLLQILCYHQVMPSHLDFLSIFGQQDDARELRFSGFRYQIFLELPQGWPVLATEQRKLCGTQIATQEGDPAPSTACEQPAKQQTQAINPSGPTSQTPVTPLVTINPDGPCVSELGRSGRCFQISYNLKTVVNAAEFKKPPPSPEEQEWSIR